MCLAQFFPVDHAFDGDTASQGIDDEERIVRTGIGEEGELQCTLGRRIVAAEIVDRRSDGTLFLERGRR